MERPFQVRAYAWAPALLFVVLYAAPAFAQSETTPDTPEFLTAAWYEAVAQPTPAPAPPTPRHTGVRAMIKGLGEDFMHLPSKENVYWAATGGSLALAMHPLDEKVATQVTGNSAADTFFKAGQVIGSTQVLLGSAAATYAFGRIKDAPKVSHLGMDLLRAIAVSTTLTQVLKVTTHRLRPDGSTHNSFPSGHSSDTFAVATALERHLGWKYSIPGYVFASYVAASRLPAQRHWLSDVVFGAGVGIIAGRTVGSHERENPASTTTTSLSPVAVPGGMGLMYSRAWR
jgi:hypothetical protein